MVHKSTIKLVTAVGLSALLALTGCSAGSRSGSQSVEAVACDVSGQDEKITVNVLAYNSSATDPFSNMMVASCTKDNVTVAHAPIDFGGQYQKTSTTLAGDTASYDVIEMYSGAVPRYASTGKLLPLNDLFEKYKDTYKLGELSEAMVKGLSYDGKLYALPTQANVGTLVYRKDIYDELGLDAPETYADVLSDAQKIQAAGKIKYPVALPFGDSTSTLYEGTLASQGKTYVDPSAKEPTFQSSEAKKGLESLTALTPYMDPQVISFDQPRVQQQLFNGTAAIAIMYSGRMADVVNPKFSQNADDFAFAPAPSIAPGGKSSAILSVDGWSIPHNSTVDPDLLFRMMAASITEEASNQALPFAYPARDKVVTEEKVPYAAAVQDALANGAGTPPLETWLGTMQSDTASLLKQALTGQQSVQDALAAAQEAAVRALAKSGSK
ncbi:extracellular solute-binding protein [Paenarthrobacter sp. OM7]|uniref:ABC transporter substrate-binding protein n=1 Tax=Paenarthrobacter sp. AMU7 TaxID=3162492 RepID=A0AB39YPF5_9MICC|nr:extracellular solute-binding protein [Paenarthrobacter sp. OM7]WGM20484.1 extracellular solute-binding protein [Paenarthrobacter sp. OM7]